MGKEFLTQSGSLVYETEADSVKITDYHGRDTGLEIPAYLENRPVTVIGKKAFLGQKRLMRIFLPETVTYMEDWAFAHCESLCEISLYPVGIGLGKGVFAGCKKLAKTNFLRQPNHVEDVPKQDREELMRSISGLFLSTVSVLDAPYLFEPALAGEGEWFKKYDARVTALLLQDDMEGYSQMISCGEEDCGGTTAEHFVVEKHKNKIRMLLVRLLYDYGLDSGKRNDFEAYLREHMPPCKEKETWQIVKEEHGGEKAYFELLCQRGFVTEENADELIRDLGAQNPEMKAYLMRYKQTCLKEQDFFAGLVL